MRHVPLRITCALITFACGLSVSTAFRKMSALQQTDLIRTSNHTPTPPPLLNQVETRTKQQIRTVDFANFSYSAQPIYESDSTFRLVNGVFEPPPYDPDGEWPSSRSQVVRLVALAYGDVTDDALEEAMVVLFEDVNGTAIPYYVYVYTIESSRLKLLWAFATGDRAQGGLRKVYADQGDLVVELYGEGARVDGEIYVNAPN